MKNNQKKQVKGKITLGSVADVTDKYLVKMVADEMLRPSFFDSFMFEKPKKYYFEPRFTLSLPYLCLDTENSEYGNGRKGLFVAWKHIDIGKKKIKNEKYKEQLVKWNKMSITTKFSRFNNLPKI